MTEHILFPYQADWLRKNCIEINDIALTYNPLLFKLFVKLINHLKGNVAVVEVGEFKKELLRNTTVVALAETYLLSDIQHPKIFAENEKFCPQTDFPIAIYREIDQILFERVRSLSKLGGIILTQRANIENDKGLIRLKVFGNKSLKVKVLYKNLIAREEKK